MSRRISVSKKHREPDAEELSLMLRELRDLVKENHAPLPDEPEFNTSDITLNRFLKARKFVVKDAYKQLAEAIEWRRTFRPTLVDCRWCDGQPGFHGIRQVGCDQEGSPVLYACFAQCQTVKNTAEDTIAHVVYLVENAMKCTDPKPKDLVFVIDCTGLTLPCCNPKLGRQFSHTFGTNYPELLKRFYLVHHNPVLEGVWKAIKVFLDPVTADKVKLVKKKKIAKIFEEDFPPDLALWFKDELKLNKSNISEAQRRFWEGPKTAGVHDPRGCPSYVTKYIEPLEQRRKTAPETLLRRSTLGNNVHLVHPNIMQYLNGLLNHVVLIDLKQKKKKLSQKEMEEYELEQLAMVDAIPESLSESDEEEEQNGKPSGSQT